MGSQKLNTLTFILEISAQGPKSPAINGGEFSSYK